MKWKYSTGYCVLCGKPVFYGQEVDQVPIQGYHLREATVHMECAKTFYENWELR